MKTTCLTLGIVALTVAVGAKETTFTGTGTWDASARWNNGVPGAGDTAIISGNGASVTADGLDVSFNTLKLGNASSHSVVYRQKGGTLTSDYLMALGYGAGATAKMELENVNVSLGGYRLIVGYGDGDARFAMTGGTLTQNLSDGLLTGVWAKKGLFEVVLSNVVWNVTAGPVKIGFGSIATSRVEIVGGRFINEGALYLGANSKNYATAGYGWNEMSICNSVWTNTGSIYLPGAHTNNACLLVSNTVFRSGSNILVARNANTTGTLEFADCANLSIVNPIQLAKGAGSCARLILRNQSNAADILANRISYMYGEGSEAWIELINSPYAPGPNWQIGTNSAQKTGFVFRDATFTPGNNNTRNITVGCGGTGHLVFSNATVEVDKNHSIVGPNAASSTGTVELVDTVFSHVQNFMVANKTGAVGYFRISGGTATFDRFLLIPRQGYGEAVMDRDAKVTVKDLNIGHITGSSGLMRICDDAVISVTNAMRLGSQQSSTTGRVDQTGGTVLFDATKIMYSLLIGCQPNSYGYYRISGGTLVIDSGTYGINIGNVDNGSGVFELAGGTVVATRFYRGDNTGTGTVVFDGGTFKVYPSDYPDIVTATLTAEVREGGAIIDTDGSDKRINTVLAHDTRVGAAANDGGLVKKGAGTLTVTKTPTFTGDVRVEAGTLDVSSTSFTLGPNAAISGGGTLVTPPGGVTITGALTLDPTNAPTLTVTGGRVTIGAGTTVTVTDASLLNKKTSYKLYNATSTTGVPTLVGFPNGWGVKNNGTSLRIRYLRGMTIDFK